MPSCHLTTGRTTAWGREGYVEWSHSDAFIQSQKLCLARRGKETMLRPSDGKIFTLYDTDLILIFFFLDSEGHIEFFFLSFSHLG